MKNKFIAPVLAFLAVLLVAAFSAFRADNSEAVREMVAENGTFGIADNFSTRTWNDTITNTESNTLTVPFALVSAWQYDVRTILTNVSGTRSVKINLDESGSAAGSDWLSIDSVTVTGTSIAPARFTGTTTYGRRHRIRLAGTTGTMVVKYTTIANYKRRE
jgi:copper chaperone CopZ